MLYLGLYEREARSAHCMCVKARAQDGEKRIGKDVCGLFFFFFTLVFFLPFPKDKKITKGKGKNNIAGACTSKDGKNQQEGAGRMPVWSLASCHTHTIRGHCARRKNKKKHKNKNQNKTKNTQKES